MNNRASKSEPERLNTGRKGGRKSRAGCLTCKIRHVKCDETKPTCNRCKASQRVCDFLTPSTIPVSRSIKPRISPKAAKVISAREYVLLPKPKSLPSVPFANQGSDHFDYFRIVCTKSFSRHFENVLWDRVVLPVAQSEPAIWSAVVALSSLIRQQTIEPLRPFAQHARTISYLHALKALNHRLGISSANLELALIGSLLFTAFEVLCGDDIAALQHFQGGLAILEEISMKAPNLSSTITLLSRQFSRFDTQACSFAVFYRSKSSGIPNIPSHFSSISDAHDALDRTVAYAYRLFKPIVGNHSRTLPYTPLPSTLSTQRNHIIRLLEDWISALSSSSEPQIDHSSIAIKVLQIQHLAATIQSSTLFYRDQLAFDGFNTEFAKILMLASQVFEAIPRGDTAPNFSFDMGIIQPLYFTACKCRHPMLRRRAIDFLERSGIEGIWDGRAMAAAARWIVKMEEDGALLDCEGDGFIPEKSRLSRVEVPTWRHGRPLDWHQQRGMLMECCVM